MDQDRAAVEGRAIEDDVAVAFAFALILQQVPQQRLPDPRLERAPIFRRGDDLEQFAGGHRGVRVEWSLGSSSRAPALRISGSPRL